MAEAVCSMYVHSLHSQRLSTQYSALVRPGRSSRVEPSKKGRAWTGQPPCRERDGRIGGGATAVVLPTSQAYPIVYLPRFPDSPTKPNRARLNV